MAVLALLLRSGYTAGIVLAVEGGQNEVDTAASKLSNR
jgi:hypothetical protein